MYKLNLLNEIFLYYVHLCTIHNNNDLINLLTLHKPKTSIYDFLSTLIDK